MALIHCPECNKEVSDRAKMCPNCGYPLCETQPALNFTSAEPNLTSAEQNYTSAEQNYTSAEQNYTSAEPDVSNDRVQQLQEEKPPVEESPSEPEPNGSSLNANSAYVRSILTKEEAINLYIGWLESKYFVRKFVLENAKKMAVLKGLYSPSYEYCFTLDADYKAQRGVFVTKKTLDRDSEGNLIEKENTEVEYTPVQGHIIQDFGPFTIAGSENLSQEIISAIEPWENGDNIPYNNEREIDGFTFDNYTVKVNQAKDNCIELAKEEIRKAIAFKVGGDSCVDIEYNGRYRNIHHLKQFVPIWCGSVTSDNKVFPFYINAVSGKVEGEVPRAQPLKAAGKGIVKLFSLFSKLPSKILLCTPIMVFLSVLTILFIFISDDTITAFRIIICIFLLAWTALLFFKKDMLTSFLSKTDDFVSQQENKNQDDGQKS